MHSYEQLERAGGLARARLLAPFRHRDFSILWGGMALSLLGDGVFMVALAWQSYELWSAPAALGTVGAAMTVPHVLLLLIGGAISDRFPRRKILVASDVVRGVAIGTMALLAITGSLTIVEIVLLAGLYGAGTAFFGPAFDALIPEVVPESLFPQANSLDQIVRPIMLRLAGPALGGITIAVAGAGWALATDAITFFICAASVMCIRAGRVRTETVTTLRTEVAAGLRFISRRTWLWGTFAAAALAYLLFMGPAEVLLPYLVKVSMHASAFTLGLVFAVGGVGSCIAALYMGSRALPRRSILAMYVMWTLSTLAVAAYGLAQLPWQLMVASFAFNALESAGTIIWATTKQRMVPAHFMGRVSSLDWFISIGLVPVSFALTGYVSSLIGVRVTLVACGLLASAITAAALLLPGMRDPENAGQKRDPEEARRELVAAGSTS